MNTRSKRAFITGVYGQDGSYLAEYLLSLGYVVQGLARNVDICPVDFLGSTSENFSVCVGDFGDSNSYISILASFAPDEIYNLAAISDLKTAREYPELTKQINFTGFRDLVAYATSINSQVRIFHALSSRVLLADGRGVIAETSALSTPQNAYDETKRDAYEQIILPYRNRGLFIASGFLCNHESPRRGNRFVTGKIATTVARIARGMEEVLYVGNVAAQRDWSFAGDFVRGMHAILQTDMPRDYVLASGTLHTVRDFIDEAFASVNIPLTWSGEGIQACGYDVAGIMRVAVSPDFYQVDDNPVLGDATLLKQITGWKPEVSFTKLVAMMVRTELEKL